MSTETDMETTTVCDEIAALKAELQTRQACVAILESILAVSEGAAVNDPVSGQYPASEAR